MSFFFPFLFALFLVLVCVVALGWKSGKGGLEEWEGWMGLEGEVVYYWQNGGVFFCCNLEEEGEE